MYSEYVLLPVKQQAETTAAGSSSYQLIVFFLFICKVVKLVKQSKIEKQKNHVRVRLGYSSRASMQPKGL